MSKESGTPVLVGDVESDAILGDCTSSFAELRTSTSRSRNFGRISQSTNRTSRSRRSSFLGPIAEADASAMILKANAPPNYTNANMNDIMKQIKAKKYYTDQFQRVQLQTKMNKNSLYFSNVAPTFYENSYLDVAQSTSIMRVRITFAIGCASLGIYFAYEEYKKHWVPKETVGRSTLDELIVRILAWGIIVPAFLFGLLSTFTEFGRRNLENITAAVFIIVGAAMIVKKPVEKMKGPIIPLLILLIPIFGITRMRYVKSCFIGWGIFLAYFTVMVISSKVLPKPDEFDNFTNISYQSINYAISVIGGMVSQYRQELLRRRNFCLQLPFSGVVDSDAVANLKAEKYSKKALMHRWSQSFRNPEVEECFYRYWYLIDPFPYENPNSGSLHAGVFRTIRFAVITLFLNQFVLFLQDLKFLEIKPTENTTKGSFKWAVILRFGVTVPLYLSAALFMYILGKTFYQRWVKEAEKAQNDALNRDIAIEMKESEAIHMKLVAEAANIKAKTQDRILDALTSKGGYVRSAQIFSSLVIAVHVCCMGAILLIVSQEKPKPVYYMGFLNAVLFAHRSGFRVRFIYATYTTTVVAIIIVAAARKLSPEYYLEYAGFVFVILCLSMMISYEEENLRRTFFVLKSIRTLEFEEWFSVVLRIQGWVKDRFRKKLKDIRQKSSKKFEDEAEVINTSAQMAQASKIGVYSQMANICIALLDVVQTAFAG